jgi:hypothetical protein
MTSKNIKGHDLSLQLAQHVEASEEIDEHDNPLSALFYICYSGKTPLWTTLGSNM